ncbi:Cell division protein FtsW [hydrothermal vent metagenome]|uniref:peptidoglycan glycosyltransferase n=1 Tax=hydrothermal vent metagenome TaxID=652676 RepID=A0A3B0QNH6_9ZZZZ
MTGARNADRMLIISTLLLVASGVVMVYSTSFVVAMKKFGDEYFFVKKHVVFAIIGLILFVIFSRIPYHLYKKLTYPILIGSVILLACLFIPGVGHKVGGATRWLKVMGITFQPSELAKVAVIIFLAYSLEAKQEVIKSFSLGFLPNILIPGVVIAMIMVQPDFGSAVTLSIMVFILCFVAGVSALHLTGLLAMVVPALYVVVAHFGYMTQRMLTYLDPWKDPYGSGFQIIQSFLAFGSGGVWGLGLGEGRQKLFYLPEAHTDFIFSVIGEELGLIGVGAVILLYVVFFVSGLMVALRAKDLFGTYLALGLTLLITLQATINMAVVMGVLPSKGLPLPLISYGGSSLVMSLIAVGIILNVYIKGNEA